MPGVSHAVLLGMGGSSLAAEVMRSHIRHDDGFSSAARIGLPRSRPDCGDRRGSWTCHTRSSLSPASQARLRDHPPARIFPATHERRRRRDACLRSLHGHHHHGSPLQQMAERERFRQVFFGATDIGGRYSSLSNVGLVPAALMGVDVGRLLERADLMVHSCAASVPAGENPAVLLGVILGTLAGDRRDKVTLITSPALASLGAWLEQLIAESTGKRGKGLIPIDQRGRSAPPASTATTACSSTPASSPPDLTQDAAVDASGARRAAGRQDFNRRRLRYRPGVLPLGDGRCGRRRGHRRQSVR